MENRPPVRLDPLISCFIPLCKSNVLMCPGKYFFHVPKSTRVEWCSAVNKQNVPRSAIYICEDHLNLKEDLLNYEEWINRTVRRPRLKPQVPSNLRNIGSNVLPSTSSVANQETEYCVSTNCLKEEDVLYKPHQQHKAVQVNPVMVHRSVGANILKRKQIVLQEEIIDEQNPSPIGSTVEFTENEGSTVQYMQEYTGRKFILNLIERNPLAYLGVVKQCYWIIDYIQKSCNIPSLHVILTLYKLKNNDTFRRMRDLFEVSIATLWRVFYKTMEVLSLFFRQFLYRPSAIDIKRNLPPVFRCNVDYASVQGIINAFEIEIEKPKKPIQQALTWSKYKQCYTIKYLMDITPDGFINFISEGHSGGISDMYLVEQSGFLETVPEHATIIADRGFKHLESHMAQKSVKVLRPPSVAKDEEITKSEVFDSKVIASLRIHIEQAVRRVHIFKLLKPHSVVSNKFVNILDDAVMIACGLNNMQTPI